MDKIHPETKRLPRKAYENIVEKWENGNTEEIIFERVLKNEDVNDKKEKGYSVEKRVVEIDNICEEILNNQEFYTEESGGDDIVRYVENGEIRKILTGMYTYIDLYNGKIDGCTAEYYYKDNEVVFVIVYDGNEEHRFYIDDRNYRLCVRYIDENGKVHNYPDGIPAYEINELGEFCTLAMQELHWAGVF